MKSILFWQKERQEAREEGHEEGRQEGLREGREEGLREGLREGQQQGLRKGLKEGKTEGIKAYSELCQEMGLSKEQAFHKIQEKLNLTDKTAKDSLEKYWKA